MKRLLSIFTLALLLTSCGDHFISDREYRKQVQKQFEATKELAKNREDQLFGVFDKHLSLKEKEALEFLYAYMPLNDLADYDGDFFLQNVKASFAAKDTFSWGKTIPEEIFRHFVLPVRINNENLDSSRVEFFEELKNRIRNLSMKDAALEINHWCHEKVTYKGSDSRTSSPLASVKTAYGRCGEESTFTVAAMRAASIPARQCYTPRWAHQDDNHAWVEVWVDGKWHYLGACEPDPDLDMGWFSSHAKRTMLVNTTVFGDYSGKEDVLRREDRFTQINVLPNYTDTKRIFVKVLDEKGSPADSAAVEFGLYNYAEFYPLTKAITDENGFCSFLTGYGDLLVWGAKNDLFDYKKVTVTDADTVLLTLSMEAGKEYSTTFDMVPPPVKEVTVKVSDSLKENNAHRFAFEDKIRGNYEKTFIDSAKSYRLAATLKMNGDTLFDILKRSRGNYREIIDFISSVPDERKDWLFPLLYAVSEKDLRDINPEVLYDQMNSAWRFVQGSTDRKFFANYILNPRVDNEFLKPYQSYFQTSFDENLINKFRKDPETLISWIKENIQIDLKNNYSRAPLTPKGVFDLKVADPPSRDIFFVAACRSFGIPARIETSTQIPQYFTNGKWVDVYFEKKKEESPARAIIILTKDPSEKEINPEYYIHFTVEEYKNGFYRSLDYETDPSISQFPSRIEVPAGSYLLVTGNRIDKGTALVNMTFFNVEASKEKTVTVSMRKKPAETIASLKINPAEFLKKVTKSSVTPGSEGTVIAWLEPEKEPSRHFIADLIRLKTSLENWKGRIILIFGSEREQKLFAEKNNKDVPANVQSSLGSPIEYERLSGSTKSDLPLVIMLNAQGEVVYQSAGYRIGTGDEIIRIINQNKGK